MIKELNEVVTTTLHQTDNLKKHERKEMLALKNNDMKKSERSAN